MSVDPYKNQRSFFLNTPLILCKRKKSDNRIQEYHPGLSPFLGIRSRGDNQIRGNDPD